MKIALGQFNPTVGDFEGNSARIVELGCEAKKRGADVAVFSELCLCGYPPQDLVERPAFADRNRKALERLAKRIPLPSVVGYVGRAQDDTGKPVANSAALIADGKILFEQRKMLLPTYDVFDESRYFQPAHTQMVFPLNAEKLGITICEDCWNDKNFWAQRLYERDPVAELVAQGSNLILNISASPYTIDKRSLRHDMLRAIAVERRVPVVYVNQVGGNDSLIFDGSSMAIMPDGRVAALAKSFEDDLVMFDTVTGAGDIRPQPLDELAAAYHALVVGTRDYVRKCGFGKVVVGLSGGVDSALVATIAADALGRGKCAGSEHAKPLFVGREHTGRAAAGGKFEDSIGVDSDYGYFRELFAVARAGVRGIAGGFDRGKYSGADSREFVDGAIEQIRVDGVEHGK